jgi:hypothetical protein
MRFCILLLSAKSEILVQSSSGFAEELNALLVPWPVICREVVGVEYE